jgi:hypothetical protein
MVISHFPARLKQTVNILTKLFIPSFSTCIYKAANLLYLPSGPNATTSLMDCLYHLKAPAAIGDMHWLYSCSCHDESQE